MNVFFVTSGERTEFNTLSRDGIDQSVKAADVVVAQVLKLGATSVGLNSDKHTGFAVRHQLERVGVNVLVCNHQCTGEELKRHSSAGGKCIGSDSKHPGMEGCVCGLKKTNAFVRICTPRFLSKYFADRFKIRGTVQEGSVSHMTFVGSTAILHMWNSKG